MDEPKLIELAQKGDKKALAELIKIYEQTVYNFSYKICRQGPGRKHHAGNFFKYGKKLETV